ncbi:TetR/AcrR family transcriptional regulator [Paenibacillus barcinonensis]|uniref:TetR/AcrR family transcriptional regulator n=1 Tax=Paenibacillus TaxID=44249 RepID=UPI001C10BD98|nr:MULTISPECIES: helix-turn-helix domain-containing protein [Paenibacillus]MBU5351453.1 TetR/AcrR family transcriptional regulator [Paenibacillus barcinonensis]MDM5277924.1 helix-turn-helix domain-containing protein [Paenibacillus silvae]
MKKEKLTFKQNRMYTILDEATKLLIEKPNASMNDIAEAANIGIATLHRYVESREQLMIHLAMRAIEVVDETLQHVKLDEARAEQYIPELIEALIPLGDKIYFLAHDATVNCNADIEEAYLKLREPVLNAFEVLQEKGFFRSDMDKTWMVEVLYSVLFLTWQQVISGNIARNAAPALVVDTLYHGFVAK